MKSQVLIHDKMRAKRVRSTIFGTAAKPRMSVSVSNLHVSVQLIDDSASKTLLSVTTVGQKSLKGNLTDKAGWVGEQVAVAAKSAKISEVVFDRGSRLYHGRVKALAEAAREGGLKF